MPTKSPRTTSEKRGRGRPKSNSVEMIAFSSRMRVDQDEQLAAITAETGIPRTRLLEEALAQYLERYEAKRK